MFTLIDLMLALSEFEWRGKKICKLQGTTQNRLNQLANQTKKETHWCECLICSRDTSPLDRLCGCTVNPFVKKQKGMDKNILQPPEECQTWWNGGHVNMAVNGKRWMAALRNVSASKCHKSHYYTPLENTGDPSPQFVFKIHVAIRHSSKWRDLLIIRVWTTFSNSERIVGYM